MANNLTREETAEILEKVYMNNFEGTELAKKITSIPKLLDKFEGKYEKMVTALKKKYPNKGDTSDNPLADYTSVVKGQSKIEKQKPEEEQKKCFFVLVNKLIIHHFVMDHTTNKKG